MKITMQIPTEIEVDAVRVVVPFRYEDEDAPYDFPLRVKNTWDVTIDLDTGVIRDWAAGTGAKKLHMKVCDRGCYYLMAGEKTVASLQQEYVPGFMPGDHYGDYIILNIGAGGEIANWKTRCNHERVTNAFFKGDDE